MSVLTPFATTARGPGRTGSLPWLIVLGIVLAALNLRTAVTSVGPVLDQVSRSLGMSGVVTGLLTSLPVLCFAVFGVVTPALARRAGEHRLLLVSLVALGTGLVVRVAVDSSWVFLAASVLALSGGAVGNVLIPTLVKRHFPGRAGAMMTVYTTALAVGTMLAAAATIPIERAAGGDWHVALGVWAALAAVAAVPWLALLRREPARDPGRRDAGPRALVRSRLAWAVAGYFGTQSLLAYVMFGWLAQMLQDRGLSSGEAGTCLAVFSALGIPVALAVPAVAARLGNQRPMIAGFAVLYVLGFAGLLAGPSALLWPSVVLIGVGMGSFPFALTLLTLRTRTADATAALSAFGQSVGYLISGAGPIVVGVLYSATGGWTLPFVLLFAVVAAQVLTGWYAAGNRMLEDEAR
ncbi:MFS transporter [Sphaerisporangium siamense]|uniref:CP family cyanate transporter-like MFS transporter n=1 Tax=Sphaerisporangium siamense TaxID=795645 RepID=A0A7W7DB12_9ACTN|nr:MFS transporter [Sphaerisporangium siamense]MBB4702078.1 CP family cyanate transporter-like MFS transporter [Sphaerisporangium siamense]GII87231.1 MFS transporter [Sphaerisporangium siamense]